MNSATSQALQTEQSLEALEAERLLAVWAKGIATPDANRLDIHIHISDLSAAVSALTSAKWGYLAAITGIDCGVDSGLLEVLYHFCEGATIVTLRVEVPRDQATVPSLCPAIPYASLFERELSEMFGVTVNDTPDSSRLFLPENWPEGVYPLRKDALIEEVTA